jgi:hypothetical protein
MKKESTYIREILGLGVKPDTMIAYSKLKERQSKSKKLPVNSK